MESYYKVLTNISPVKKQNFSINISGVGRTVLSWAGLVDWRWSRHHSNTGGGRSFFLHFLLFVNLWHDPCIRWQLIKDFPENVYVDEKQTSSKISDCISQKHNMSEEIIEPLAPIRLQYLQPNLCSLDISLMNKQLKIPLFQQLLY